MSFRLVTALAIATFGVAPAADFGDFELNESQDQASAAAIIDRYLKATHAQKDALRDVSMEIDIEARLPRLGKSGTMHALRFISNLGKITYSKLTFQGDNTIKKDVIARYLNAEQEATEKPSLGITPENYKFKYRGLYATGDWKLYLFELSPRKKRIGLFDGWLWLEAKSGLPVRESGQFVKTPSVFLSNVTFVRDYEIRDGIAVPTRIESTIETRLVGKAEIEITYSQYEKGIVSNGETSISSRESR